MNNIVVFSAIFVLIVVQNVAAQNRCRNGIEYGSHRGIKKLESCKSYCDAKIPNGISCYQNTHSSILSNEAGHCICCCVGHKGGILYGELPKNYNEQFG